VECTASCSSCRHHGFGTISNAGCRVRQRDWTMITLICIQSNAEAGHHIHCPLKFVHYHHIWSTSHDQRAVQVVLAQTWKILCFRKTLTDPAAMSTLPFLITQCHRRGYRMYITAMNIGKICNNPLPCTLRQRCGKAPSLLLRRTPRPTVNSMSLKGCTTRISSMEASGGNGYTQLSSSQRN